MKKVIAFGTFDPLHQGHIYFLQQAKALGDHLTVVVAHDSAIRTNKKREPFESHQKRLQKVGAVQEVDAVIVGQETAHNYELLDTLDFDIIALGYDQMPTDEFVHAELLKRNKGQVAVVRLKPHHPEKFKSSFLRSSKP